MNGETHPYFMFHLVAQTAKFGVVDMSELVRHKLRNTTISVFHNVAQ